MLTGAEHAIPFAVAETDVTIDVIALCPVPPILHFELRTPDGTVIAGAGGNVQFTRAAEVSFYRILLPALPASPSGSHGGT